MTEQELQQYLLSKYPKENEECKWKEFKNMKNDFNGKEKDDVIYVFVLTINLLQSLVSLRKIFISEKFREVSAHKPSKI